MWKEVPQTRKKEVLSSHHVESSRPSLTTVSLYPRSYFMPMLASIHAETQSDRVAEACLKVAERLAVLGGEVKTASNSRKRSSKQANVTSPLFTSFK